MKKFTLMLVMLLGVVLSINAKSTETTLWKGTDTGANISVTRSSLVAGATITLEFNWLGTEGAQFSCFYLKNEAREELRNWQWVNNGETYSFTLTQNQIDDIPEDQPLYFKTEVPDKMTFKEIINSIEIEPAGTTKISTESYTADWNGKQYAAVSDAKIGDVLKFTYTATGTYFQIYVMNYPKGETFENKAYNVSTNETYTYEYVIPNYATLKKVREEGFSIKGADFTISSVDLLTYDDSYGYVTITIGETGYATWSSDKKYNFASAGVTAYYASNVTTGTVTLTPMDVTWDLQGYILKATPDTYDVLESLTTDETYNPSTNYLKPNISESTIAASVTGTYHYIFAKDNEGNIAFYKLTADHTLAAHKAYLETPNDIAPTSQDHAPAIHLVFEEENNATALDSSAEANRCSKVIQNGRLLIIKNGITYDLTGNVVR